MGICVYVYVSGNACMYVIVCASGLRVEGIVHRISRQHCGPQKLPFNPRRPRAFRDVARHSLEPALFRWLEEKIGF